MSGGGGGARRGPCLFEGGEIERGERERGRREGGDNAKGLLCVIWRIWCVPADFGMRNLSRRNLSRILQADVLSTYWRQTVEWVWGDNGDRTGTTAGRRQKDD